MEQAANYCETACPTCHKFSCHEWSSKSFPDAICGHMENNCHGHPPGSSATITTTAGAAATITTMPLPPDPKKCGKCVNHCEDGILHDCTPGGCIEIECPNCKK